MSESLLYSGCRRTIPKAPTELDTHNEFEAKFGVCETWKMVMGSSAASSL